MKILHIATIDSGGAANAATRIHLGLLENNIDSKFLFMHKTKTIPNSFQAGKKSFLASNSLASRILRKVFRLKLQYQKNNEMLAGLKGNYELFSCPYSDYRLEDEPLVQEADIIHLHWVANFLHYPTFFKNINKPIVWTFHDFNPLLGGFHYPGDVERNAINFSAIENKFKQEKQKAITSVNNLTITTYSKWLIDYVKQEEGLKNRHTEYILAGIDLKKFKPINQHAARDYFDIPVEKKVLLFVSENITNYRKGLDLLQEALHLIIASEDVFIVIVGDRNKNNDVFGKSKNILYVDKVVDDRLLSLLYSAADFFVMPSREEVLGLVALEAMACGTPAIAFANGGLRDVIINGKNGLLVDKVDAQSLAEALTKAISNEYVFNRDDIRKYAIDYLEKSINAAKYKELYQKILNP